MPIDRLSLLGQLTAKPLATPCDTPWDRMAGDDKVRHCASCDREVFSLSDMTEIEAELRLLNARDVTPCIRYSRDLDGSVIHRAPPRPVRAAPSATARAMVAATALGGGLLVRSTDAHAKDKTVASPPPPTQCVMLNDAPPAAAPAPAPAPASAPSSGAAAAPAPAPAPPPPTQPLAGAPMPVERPVAWGLLTIKSKVPRQVNVHGLSLTAPVTAFRMTPGDFVLEVTETAANAPKSKKPRSIKVTIKRDQTTTIDLDKR